LQLNEQLNEKAENIETDFNFNLDSLNLAEELNENNTLKNVLGQEFDNLEEKISKDVAKNQKSTKSSKIRIDVSEAGGDLPVIDKYLPEHTKKLPASSQNRLLLAKLKVIEKELEKQLTRNATLNADLTISRDRMKDLELSNSSNTRKIAALSSSESKLKNQVEEYKNQILQVTNKKISSDKELAKILREEKTKTNKFNQQEIRLNRAIDELEKYKNQLSKVKKESKETNIKETGKYENTVAENNRLTRLNEDYKMAIKKQFKLIDVLKQQKMHLETARTLQFSENEWNRVLDGSVKETKSFC